jgi:hypothetical protein
LANSVSSWRPAKSASAVQLQGWRKRFPVGKCGRGGRDVGFVIPPSAQRSTLQVCDPALDLGRSS